MTFFYLKVLRLKGGGKRGRGGCGISDFEVKAGDPPVIAAALRLQPMALEDFVASMDMNNGFYDNIVEQKNGERVLQRFCSAHDEFEAVKDRL